MRHEIGIYFVTQQESRNVYMYKALCIRVTKCTWVMNCKCDTRLVFTFSHSENHELYVRHEKCGKLIVYESRSVYESWTVNATRNWYLLSHTARTTYCMCDTKNVGSSLHTNHKLYTSPEISLCDTRLVSTFSHSKNLKDRRCVKLHKNTQTVWWKDGSDDDEKV